MKMKYSEKMNEPATKKQLEWIEKHLGYDVKNKTYTKKDCAEIISSQPANQEQIKILKRFGIKAEKITLGQFHTIRTEIELLIQKINKRLK